MIDRDEQDELRDRIVVVMRDLLPFVGVGGQLTLIEWARLAGVRAEAEALLRLTVTYFDTPRK